MCIATGLISEKNTNVDEAKKISGEILDGMTGLAVSAVHFKKENDTWLNASLQLALVKEVNNF